MAQTTGRHLCAIECKSTTQDGDGLTVELIASVFHSIDLGGDRVLPGAFKTAPERLAGKSGIKLKSEHSELIGVVLEVKEVEDGLWVKAQIANDPAFTKYAALIRCKALTQCSFGYRVLANGAEVKRENGRIVRELKALDLFEVSLVEAPMHTGTEILGLKNAKGLWSLQNGIGSLDGFFDSLRYGTLSPAEAQIAHGIVDIQLENWRAQNPDGGSDEPLSKILQLLNQAPPAA